MMAKTPAAAAAAAATAAVNTSPTDQLIAALARLVNDDQRAPMIRHLFLSQTNGNLQLSLDMHNPTGN